MNMTQHLIHFKGGIFINKGLTQSCYKKKTDDRLRLPKVLLPSMWLKTELTHYT